MKINYRELAEKLVYPLPMAQADYRCNPPIPAHIRQIQVNNWREKTIIEMTGKLEAYLAPINSLFEKMEVIKTKIKELEKEVNNILLE